MIRKIFLILVGMWLLCGCASATDYYVSPTGTGDGLTVETPGNITNFDSVVLAGDTVKLLNGTYSQIGIIYVTHSGNATHPIIFTAYNGTPILDGVINTSGAYGINLNSNSYITISNLSFINYYNQITNPGGHVTIQNCNFTDSGESPVKICNGNYTDNLIENCTIENPKWNGIQITGGNSLDYPAERITIRNNRINNSDVHNAIDLYKFANNITIENNLISNCSVPGGNIYTHDGTHAQRYLYIRNNTIRDSDHEGMYLKVQNNDSIIENNTFINISNKAIDLEILSNVTIQNNKYYTVNYPFRIITCDNILLEDEYIDPSCHPSGDFGWIYFTGGNSLSIYNHTGYLDLNLASVLNPVTYGYRNGRVFQFHLMELPQLTQLSIHRLAA